MILAWGRARRVLGAALCVGLLVSLSACAVNLPGLPETNACATTRGPAAARDASVVAVAANAYDPTATNGRSALYALRAGDGALQWKLPDASGDSMPRALKDGVLYVLTASQVQGHVYLTAVSVANGAVRWRYQNDDSDGQVAPPTADALYLSSLNADAMTADGQWSYVSAVRASAGTLLWRTQIPRANVTLSEPVTG